MKIVYCIFYSPHGNVMLMVSTKVKRGRVGRWIVTEVVEVEVEVGNEVEIKEVVENKGLAEEAGTSAGSRDHNISLGFLVDRYQYI